MSLRVVFTRASASPKPSSTNKPKLKTKKQQKNRPPRVHQRRLERRHQRRVRRARRRRAVRDGGGVLVLEPQDGVALLHRRRVRNVHARANEPQRDARHARAHQHPQHGERRLGDAAAVHPHQRRRCRPARRRLQLAAYVAVEGLLLVFAVVALVAVVVVERFCAA